MRKFGTFAVVLVTVFLVAARAPDPPGKPLFERRVPTRSDHVCNKH